jgi:D-alanyl-lipoteichoic acid acyltransferase DltB (MBOAT superfamily)
MIPFATIALGLFWVAAIKLWFADGPKIPLICIVLWFVFFFEVPMLHWPGVVFIVAESVLGVVLLLIDKYKSALL